MDLEVTLNLKPLDEWTEALEKELAAALLKTGFFIETRAKLKAPVDTGYLRNTIYLVSSDFDGYGLANASIQGKGKPALLRAEAPRDRWEVVVAAGAEYAAYVEYGYFAKRGTTHMSYRGKSKKGNDRLTAQRIQDRAYGTFVQGRFFFTEALRESEVYFADQVAKAVAKAGRSFR